MRLKDIQHVNRSFRLLLAWMCIVNQGMQLVWAASLTHDESRCLDWVGWSVGRSVGWLVGGDLEARQYGGCEAVVVVWAALGPSLEGVPHVGKAIQKGHEAENWCFASVESNEIRFIQEPHRIQERPN